MSLASLPYRVFAFTTRLTNKIYSLMISGAFANFGKHSVLERPLRLSSPDCIHVGSNVFIGSASWLQAIPNPACQKPVLRIGDGTSVSGSCVISAGMEVVLEEKVLLARNVYISDHIHAYEDEARAIQDQGLGKLAAVHIEAGAWLGQNVVVCPGVRIGRGAVVGAGSVVTKDVPARSLAVGSPAVIKKRFDGREPEGSDAGD